MKNNILKKIGIILMVSIIGIINLTGCSRNQDVIQDKNIRENYQEVYKRVENNKKNKKQVTKELTILEKVEGWDIEHQCNIWSDGKNVYYSDENKQYVLTNGKWEKKEWEGLTEFSGTNLFIHDKNIYCGSNSDLYVLKNDKWNKKFYKDFTKQNFNYPESVWDYGSNLYKSNGEEQKIFNFDKKTWENKEWKGLVSFNGEYVWHDGCNVYYSEGNKQYVLNGDTWEKKTWTGLTNFNGNMIWTDGTSYYYTNDGITYIFK